MKYSDFCRPFRSKGNETPRIIGKKTQPHIALFFFEIALCNYEKSIYDESTYKKWYSGDREPPIVLWEKVIDEINEEKFRDEISKKINKNAIKQIALDFGLDEDSAVEIDAYELSDIIKNQFLELARGNGEADNIFINYECTPIDFGIFSNYLDCSYNKYSKLKTLLYTSKERNFYDFYVCNTIENNNKNLFKYKKNSERIIINDVTLEKLLPISKCVLLSGMGGIGKSMIMRHLFLTALKESKTNNKIPILLTLREYDFNEDDIMSIIYKAINRYGDKINYHDIERILCDGNCQILLDGLDEIKIVNMDNFCKKLEMFIDKYPHNQYVMSSRNISNFVEFSSFSIFSILPFSKEKSLELIQKLEYCPEEPKLKEKFLNELDSTYYYTHEEFVTNPLLLTLMLMSYRRFSDIPERKYLFYEQAYATLLQRHDSDKLAYRRVFKSVNDPSDFTLVFRELCAKSYRKGHYEFSYHEFDEKFHRLNTTERMDPYLMKLDNFIYDACNSVCLMFEESNKYHFLHRSFQEYFFADYYARADDVTIRKLAIKIEDDHGMPLDDNSAFRMFFDLAREKVERLIFLPYLRKIFATGEDKIDYWNFLAIAFRNWNYSILDEDMIDPEKINISMGNRHFFSERRLRPKSKIMILLFDILKIPSSIIKNRNFNDFCYPELENAFYYAEYDTDEDNRIRLKRVLKKSFNELNDLSKKNFETDEYTDFSDFFVKDDVGNLKVYGKSYIFDFKKGIYEKEKYKEIVEYWEKENAPIKSKYSYLKDYYLALESKFSNFDDMSDDDF